jgi:hypothetical protein
VNISEEEYALLLAAQAELNALHSAGVDNWDFYYDALRDAGLVEED